MPPGHGEEEEHDVYTTALESARQKALAAFGLGSGSGRPGDGDGDESSLARSLALPAVAGLGLGLLVGTGLVIVRSARYLAKVLRPNKNLLPREALKSDVAVKGAGVHL